MVWSEPPIEGGLQVQFEDPLASDAVALPIIANTFRVALKWSVPSGLRPAVNVIHVRSLALTPSGIYSVLNAHVNAGMWAQTTNGVGIAEVDITPLDGVGNTVANVTGTPAKWSGGTSGGDIIPAAAVIIKLVTDTRGRSGRGRIFLPWVVEVNQSMGNFDSGTASSMSSAWASFATTIASADVQLVVASYKESTARDVTGVFCETLLATQRRRQPRR